MVGKSPRSVHFCDDLEAVPAISELQISNLYTSAVTHPLNGTVSQTRIQGSESNREMLNYSSIFPVAISISKASTNL